MPEALKVLNIVSNKYGINLHFDHFDFSSYEYYSKHGQMMPMIGRSKSGSTMLYFLDQ